MLWFWTNKWISIYDINNDDWTDITTSDWLLHNHIISINTTANWKIWIWTNKWVSLYNNDTWTSYTQKKNSIGLSNIHVSVMYEDSLWFVWFGTNNWLDKFDISEDEIVDTYSDWNPNSINSNNFNYIIEDDNTNMWVWTDDWLSRYNRTLDSWDLFINPINSWLISNNIRYLFIDSQNFLWIWTDSWVSKYDLSSNNWVKNYDSSNELSWDYIYSIYENKNNEIFILTDWWLDTISD